MSKSVEKLLDTFCDFCRFLTWPLSAGPFCNPLKTVTKPNRTGATLKNAHKDTSKSFCLNLFQPRSQNTPIFYQEMFVRSLGTTPISGKTLSEQKGHSRSSRRVPGYSRSNSRSSKGNSRNEKSYPQFSEQLPERFPELVGTHMKDFHLPLHSRSAFSRIGVGPARQSLVTLSSGLPNAKSQSFNCAISQIASLRLVVALNRDSKLQIAARYAAFWHAIALASFLQCP